MSDTTTKTDPVALRVAAKLAMRTGMNIAKSLGLSAGETILAGERLSTIIRVAEERGDLPPNAGMSALLVLAASTLDTVSEESTQTDACDDGEELDDGAR